MYIRLIISVFIILILISCQPFLQFADEDLPTEYEADISNWSITGGTILKRKHWVLVPNENELVSISHVFHPGMYHFSFILEKTGQGNAAIAAFQNDRKLSGLDVKQGPGKYILIFGASESFCIGIFAKEIKEEIIIRKVGYNWTAWEWKKNKITA